MKDDPKQLIVIADADEWSVRQMETLLKREGYAIITTNRGGKTLELLRHIKPDLLLIDATLPDVSAYQICTQLREARATAGMPILFASALDADAEKKRAFESGATDYLTKPISEADLLQHVRSNLQNRAMWYQIRAATDLWNLSPLPQKFDQFRELLLRRFLPDEEIRRQLLALRPSQVYRITEFVDITEREVAEKMAEFFGLKYLDTISQETIQSSILPPAFCRSNGVVAIRTEDAEAGFVLANPFAWGLDELDVLDRAFRGQPYRLFVTTHRQMTSLFFRRATDEVPRGAAAAEERRADPGGASPDRLMEEASQVSAVAIVNSLIAEAVRLGASDLHLQPERATVAVRYRVDGLMRTVMPLQRSQLPALVARLKIMCGMDISESRKPQDGGCMVQVDGRDIELRASTLPGNHGEKVVLRLLGHSGTLQKLDAVGFGADMLRDYRRLLLARHGMILITGPTGSGKTTTLYATLNQLNTEQVNIVTVEDPIELDLPRVTQVQVHERAGRTFANTLRSWWARSATRRRRRSRVAPP
jgi:type II secretory ATPase GspE/PulE/Tfp pilus assembly ATPase PilB-like protein